MASSGSFHSSRQHSQTMVGSVRRPIGKPFSQNRNNASNSFDWSNRAAVTTLKPRFQIEWMETDMTDQKVAIVTAGGSGMGADSARRLAEDGFNVAILSSSGKGEALANELGGIGLTGSNKSSADLQNLVDAVLDNWGRVDVLVNSAGHGPRAPILDISDADWHEGMEVYFLNAVRATRIVAPIMIEQKSGTIINISTFAAFEPDPVFPTSGVMRAGLAAYTKLFADKYAADNVRMNNVLPGFIDSLPENPDFLAKIPMGRYGSSFGEIAATCACRAAEGCA